MTTYTTTREYDTTAAHAEEFYAIDYTLAYADQRELVERFADSLEYAVRYDDTTQQPSEMIHQIIDEWLVTGDHAIAEMWLRANRPQPDNHHDGIISQMVAALAELGHEWLNALLDPEDTLAGTMARLNTLWPVVFVEDN
jgi:hypothetical protein